MTTELVLYCVAVIVLCVVLTSAQGKPNEPTITPIEPVVTGGNITVECRTNGSRSVANVSWAFHDQTLKGQTTVTWDNSTGSYTIISVLRRTVTSADNGQNLTCEVSHNKTRLTTAISLDVQFPVPPSSTRISGNQTVVANGVNPLSLTCTTGSSNPASNITWRKGSSTLNGDTAPSERPGENNGVIRSQVLTLRPTRNDNGEKVTCSVSNAVSSAKDTASVMLALKYRPIVTIANASVTFKEETATHPLHLPCSVDSNPPSHVTWSHNGQVVKQAAGVSSLPYSITSRNRTSYGNYTCTADNGVAPADSKTYAVEVKFRPLHVSIQKPNVVVANGRNTMSLSCVTDSSNPVAMVTWSTGSIQTSMPVHSNTKGSYGGTVVTSKVTFTPTREHDGETVSCTAMNSLFTNQPVSKSTVIDNIRYSPLISALIDQVVVEGEKVVLKCTASSKPVATFKWTKDSRIVAQGSGSASYNGLDYNITAVSRSQAGTYTCTADNQVPPAGNKQARLSVQYPPDVVVRGTVTTVESKSTTLTCNATGIPDSYTYDHWEHIFNGVPVLHPEQLPASRELTLTGLSYAHSGVYRCGASNGVKGVVSHGEGTLLVQSLPILMWTMKEIKSSGQLGKPTIVAFQYYSNAGRGSVRVLRTNGTFKEPEVHQKDVHVKLPVFLSEIPTAGTEVTINITVKETSQFGANYQIIVTNDIGNVSLSLIIQPLGPPETPQYLDNAVFDHHTALVTWVSGFPNGLNQTFVIQLRTDKGTWRNITQSGGMSYQQTHHQRLDDLAGSQLYYWRMLAVNGEGESEPTSVLSFKTRDAPASSLSTGATVGLSLTGGLLVGVLIVAGLVGILMWRRGVLPIFGKEKTLNSPGTREENFYMEDKNSKQDAGATGITSDSVDTQHYESLKASRDSQCYEQLETNREDIPQNLYENAQAINKQKNGKSDPRTYELQQKSGHQTNVVYENFGKRSRPAL